MTSRLRFVVAGCVFACSLAACSVGVRSGSGTAVGGGPAQATSQAEVVMRSTTVALATNTAGSFLDAPPCDCDSGK